jgi:RNA polymerase sigma factor (sigma-70 family)
MSPTPSQIFEQAQQGDLAAFEALIRHYQSCVCAISLGITRNLSASEEVAQDVFLTAWTRRETVQQAESFPAWLRQIARNKSREWLRKDGRYRSRVEADSDAVARAPASEAQVEQVLLRAEEQSLLEAALDELPDDTRELVILYYREGQSTRQVANLLELREATVRKRLSRARQQLKQHIEQQLSASLKRTRPGTTLTAAILAAVALASPESATAGTASSGPSSMPGPSNLSPRLHRGLLVGAVGGLLLGPALWFLVSNDSPAEATAVSRQQAVGPSATRRAARAALPPVVVREPVEAAPPLDPPTTPQSLLVRLGSGKKLTRTTLYQPILDPSRWFPTPDEAPLGESPVGRSLQQLLDEMAAHGPEDGDVAEDARALVQLAHAEGVLPLASETAEDPWASLVAVEVARLELASWPDNASPEVAGKRVEALTALYETVEGLVSQADPILVDYGRLYEVWVLSQPGVRVTPDEAKSSIEGALAQTNDPQVVASVLMSAPILSHQSTPSLDPSLLRTTRESVSQIALPAERWAAAQVMVDQAYLHQSAEDVRWWMDLSREATQVLVTQEPDNFLTTVFSEEHARLSAELADLSGTPPATWQEAFRAAVWDCHRASPVTVPLQTEVRYTGAWEWEDSERRHPLQQCLSQNPPASPTPDPGTAIALQVQVGY